MIELKIKDFKNIDPNSLYLEPLIKVMEENYYLDEPHLDLWGSIFLSEEKDYAHLFDFNLVEYDCPKIKVVSIYAIEDGLTLYDHYASFYIVKSEVKNRKYRNLNNTEYLKVNELTDLQ